MNSISFNCSIDGLKTSFPYSAMVLTKNKDEVIALLCKNKIFKLKFDPIKSALIVVSSNLTIDRANTQIFSIAYFKDTQVLLGAK
jgi:hypothetical protein